MKDRNVQHASRFRLTKVPGTDDVYDLIPAPGEVYEEGTLINKSALLKDATAAQFGLDENAVPDDILSKLGDSALYHTIGLYEEHIANTLGDLMDGVPITFNIDGVPKEFIVVNQGKPSSMYDDSCNGTWLMMKEPHISLQFDSSNSNDYKNSQIHSYLNSDFLNLLDSDIKNQIKTVKIPYINGTGTTGSVETGANGLSAKVFSLSMPEIGYPSGTGGSTQIADDGSCLSYFSGLPRQSEKRKAYLNGVAKGYWLRSARLTYSNHAFAINRFQGDYSSYECNTTSVYVRPAFILPSDYPVNVKYYSDENKNIYTEQKYFTGITDLMNEIIKIPVEQIMNGTKIATGSYTGTGTYGSSNPNSLTFWFVPKLIFIFVSPSSAGTGDNAIIPAISLTNSYLNGGYLYGSLRNGANLYAKINANTVSWYHTNGESGQMNYSGWKYNYIAIG